MSTNEAVQPISADALVTSLDAVRQAVIITDAGGRIELWSRAAEQLYGWAAGEVVGRQILDVTPADDVMADAASVMEALLRGETWSGDMVLRRRNGETFLASVTDHPVLDGDGRVVRIIGISEDVTERRMAEAERERLLQQEREARSEAESSRTRLVELAEASRYQAALLETLYDSSVDGMLVVGADGRVLSHNRRFLEMWGFDEAMVPAGDDALLEAAQQKVADAGRFVSGVLRAYADRDRTHDEVLLADGRTFDRYGSPLHAADGDYLGYAWSFRDVTEERRRRAEVAAAGVRATALARTLQQSLLPPRLPTPPGLDLAARYHPALDGIDVGGDFYDVFAVGDDWVLVIGDVCGKGAEAAAVTALIRYTVRAVAIQQPEPAAVLHELNEVMLHDSTGEGDAVRFATVCVIRLRPHGGGVVANLACGGHPLPMVVRAGGDVEEVGVHGTVMGVTPTVELATTEVHLDAGDCIVAVTDGVLEARDARGELFDRGRLAAQLAAATDRSPEAVAGAIEEAAVTWQGGEVRDDIAVLVAGVAPRR